MFKGRPDAVTRDAMLVAALSGMRLEEIFQLQVRDCDGGLFKVRRSKTVAGERTVPIHSVLADLVVARRSEGKAAKDYLLHEGDATGWDGMRSAAFSKRFNQTYRRRCGVHDKPDGRQKSRVNFHSFRNWFITKADRAGCRREDIERAVGHRVGGMSLGHYSGGPSMEQLRAVVESVKLPPEVHLTGRHTTDRSHAGGLLVRASP